MGSVSSDTHAVIAGEIERVREQMVRLGNQLGFMHPEVQRCSQHLDILLLRFYELKQHIKEAAALEERP